MVFNIDQHYKLEYGESVRRFFLDDLSRYKSGICLLPEWICKVMSEVVLQSKHELIFYPPNSYAESVTPLETDWFYLINLIKRIQSSDKEIIVLLAFPFGYIDIKKHLLFNFIKNHQFKNIHIYLDLAQSYGLYNFLPDLDICQSIYLSFNGRKLINKGGAIRISFKKEIQKISSSYSITQLNHEINLALQQQCLRWTQTIKDLEHIVGKNICNISLKRFNRLLNLKSNHNRTVITIKDTKMIDSILKEGYGQKLHPSPQDKLTSPSSVYREWEKNILLIFEKPRL